MGGAGVPLSPFTCLCDTFVYCFLSPVRAHSFETRLLAVRRVQDCQSAMCGSTGCRAMPWRQSMPAKRYDCTALLLYTAL